MPDALPDCSAIDTPHDAIERRAMQPVEVKGCFGWLHTPPSGAGAGVAVLLCPALGNEGSTAHRQFRLLANALADSGYPTLRFDYLGTGDSSDPSPELELCGEWLRSIHQSADWLRNITGASRLVLCGLRLGATLAAVAAAQRADVAALVLLAPLVRGRSFIRQLQIEAKLAGYASSDPTVELQGSFLSPETIGVIASLDLGRVVLQGGSAVAIFRETVSSALEECSLGWERNGVTVTHADFSGLEPMLRPSYMSHEPPADVSRIVGWVSRSIPAVPVANVAVPSTRTLRHPGFDEVPLRFGPDRRLFGMLCRPVGTEDGVAVLILNSGGDPHYGSGRLNVDIARRLAQAGIASLRFDFAGLGDSLGPNDAETHLFETDRRADISAAIDALLLWGFRRFALHGLCAGAFHAFHAALADARIGTLLLLNLPLFEWRVGDKVELLGYVQKGPLHFGARLGAVAAWRKLLSRDVNIGEMLLKVLSSQVRWIAARIALFRTRLAWKAGFGLPSSFAISAAQALSGRTRTLILMSPNDPGLAILGAEFGAGRSPPGMTLRIVPEIDHVVSKATMRRTIAEMMIDFVRSGTPAGAEVPLSQQLPELHQDQAALSSRMARDHARPGHDVAAGKDQSPARAA